MANIYITKYERLKRFLDTTLKSSPQHSYEFLVNELIIESGYKKDFIVELLQKYVDTYRIIIKNGEVKCL